MKPLSPSRIKALVWGLVAFFLLILALAASMLAWSGRHAALQGREEQVSRFVAGAEVALNRSFLSVDLLLSGVDSMLGLSTSMIDWLDTDASGQRLGYVTRGNMLVSLTALVGADGAVLASSEPLAAREALRLPDGFLQAALSPTVSGLVVSEPAVNFNSMQGVLYFARPLKLASGDRLVAVSFDLPRSDGANRGR